VRSVQLTAVVTLSPKHQRWLHMSVLAVRRIASLPDSTCNLAPTAAAQAAS